MKIAYLGGPIDADHVRACWMAGVADETYAGTRYLVQFYDTCARLGIATHVVAPTRERRRSGSADIEYWRPPLEERSGLLYHLGQVLHLGRFALRAVTLRCDAVVVVPSPPYWFVFLVLRLFGIAVVPSAHRVLWAKLRSPTAAQSLLLRLTKRFFVHGCGPVLAVSEEIAEQVVGLTGGAKDDADILVFRPTYDPAAFEIPPPADVHAAGDRPAGTAPPFRVLFVGRVERDKGVFLLLDVAQRFASEGRSDVVFDICGTGSALAELRRAVEEAGLGATVTLRGHCDRRTVLAMYAGCDVVVVPTTTDFVEGFNKVVAEAVLARRPVVTSEVCPALRTVEDAAVVVPPDQPGPYADAILRLQADRALYRTKQDACDELREQFLDPGRSWGCRFEEALSRLGLVGA